ncbi:MAG TPA: iron-containing redox enzyme family protein [Blastocatellia bacterium]|nr:iron-containing redox enzyme family protein [Blastocatellia bacterium]
MRADEDRGAQGFAGELLAVVRAHAYRDPMFDAIRNGEMSREGIKLWTLQAMLVVREFTRFISAIHSNCPDREAQELLAANLWEEHGGGSPRRDHLALIGRMARGLGATEDEVHHTAPLPETGDYIDHCLRVTRFGSIVEGLTAIGIGIEHSMPLFFGALAEALQRRYGLSREDTEFLSVHIAEDKNHARRAIELIERYADTDEVRTGAKRALVETLEVKRRFSEALFAHCSSRAARA